MEASIAIPTDYASAMLETLFNGPSGRKVTMNDATGTHVWELGIAIDEELGVDFLQINVRDTLLVPANFKDKK